MKSFNFRILLLVLLPLPLQACATTYSAAPIEASVVDAQTGEPVAGVNVVAHWELDRAVPTPIPGYFGRDPRGPAQLQIMETVTDQNGHFSFPAWGPLPVPPLAYLNSSDPAIVMFKPGYSPFGTTNYYPSTFNFTASSTRTSQINGTTIKIKKFEGDLKAYAEELWFLGSSLDFARSSKPPGCEWTRIPRMLAAVNKQERIFEDAKIYTSLPSIERLPFQDQCGSAQELLKEYLK